MTQQHPELARRIDIIERGYEYLLAFAAQGRKDEAGSEVRDTLLGMHAALEGLDRILTATLNADTRSQRHDATAFITTVRDDALKARDAICRKCVCTLSLRTSD